MKKNRIEILLASGLADCYMITSPENQYYYSGFTGGEATLVMTKNERLLFTDSRYMVQAKGEAPDFLVIDIASLKAIDYVMDKKNSDFEPSIYRNESSAITFSSNEVLENLVLSLIALLR